MRGQGRFERMPAFAEIEQLLEDNHFQRRLSHLEELRAPFEQMWREIGEHILPRMQWSEYTPKGAALPRRRLLNTGVVDNERLGATLHGYLLSPFSPFIEPYVENYEGTRADKLWFEGTTRHMHSYLTGSASTFRVQSGELMPCMTGMGTGILYIGSGRQRLPFVKNISLWQCYIDENEETGIVDTVYRKFPMRAWRAYERWPHDSFKKLIDEGRGNTELVFLHITEPRPSHEKGSRFAHEKPFRHAIISWSGAGDKPFVVEAGGQAEMPFAVGRMQTVPGHVWGVGPGWTALPMVKAENALFDIFMRGVELNGDPPLLDYTHGVTLDRRPGGRTYAPDDLFLMRNQKPLEEIFSPRDVRSPQEALAMVREDIHYTFYSDWMRLRENAQMTATEIHDRRDMRMRMMSPTVARTEQELLNPLSERVFGRLQAAGVFAPAPETLAGRDVSFRYKSPIAQAMRESDMEKLRSSADLAAVLMQIDPQVAMVPDVEEMYRQGADLLGVSVATLKSREAVARAREEVEQQAAMQEEAGLAQVAATALRDGGQGVASLANAEAGNAV